MLHAVQMFGRPHFLGSTYVAPTSYTMAGQPICPAGSYPDPFGKLCLEIPTAPPPASPPPHTRKKIPLPQRPATPSCGANEFYDPVSKLCIPITRTKAAELPPPPAEGMSTGAKVAIGAAALGTVGIIAYMLGRKR